VEQQKWSGQSDWSIEYFEIDSGMHNLKWVYTKDQAVSEGNDCAWIDMITLPKFVNETDSTSLQINFSRITETLEIGDSISRSLIINNVSNNELNYSISIVYPGKSEAWISVDKENGNLISSESDTILINLSAKGQSVGNYEAILIITVDETNETIEIPATLTVTQSLDIIAAESLSDLKIYPNPMKSYVEIEFITKEKYVFAELLDIRGNSLYKKKYNTIPGQQNRIIIYESDLRNEPLQKGIYFIKLETIQNTFTRKLVKE
jgi:hypothetical protein